MQKLQSILNDALKADASEIIIEAGKDIQVIKQNTATELTEIGPSDVSWLQSISEKLLGDSLSQLTKENPLKENFPYQNFGNIYFIAKQNDALTLRFFLPPHGEKLCEDHWKLISEDKSDIPLDIEVSGQKTPDTPIQQIEVPTEAPIVSPTSDIQLESPIETPTEDIQIETVEEPKSTEIRAVKIQEDDITLDVSNANSKENSVNIDMNANESAQIEIQQVAAESIPEASISIPEVSVSIPEIKEELPKETKENIKKEIEDENSDEFDIDSAVRVGNLGSAPASEPLPPLPPRPSTIPGEKKIEDPGIVLNTSIVRKQRPASEINTALQNMIASKASHLHLSTGHKLSYRVQTQLLPKGNDILTDVYIHEFLETLIPKDIVSSWREDRESNLFIDRDQQRYRVHIFKDFNGMNAVIKIISSAIPSFQDLNMPQRVNELCEFKHGLILIAGPSNTLLETLLASLGSYLGNILDGHIISLEHPIRFFQNTKKALLNQREIGLHTKSFASGLESALQENPDVILLSQLSDKESIKLALKASTETLIFAGMMAQSLAEARSILDSQLSDSPKLLIDAVLRDILFVRMGSDGKPQFEILMASTHKSAS